MHDRLSSSRLVTCVSRVVCAFLVAVGAPTAVLIVVPPARAQSDRGAATIPVRLAEISRREVFLPLYGALDRGLFRAAGLEVASKITVGPDQTLATLLSGEADIALGGPDTAILSARTAERDSVRIVAALSRFVGSYLVSREIVPAESFRWDLVRGKTVMGWRTASLPGLFFEHALRRARLNPRTDVEYRTNVPVPARLRAWRQGHDDFAAFDLTEAAALEREKAGYPVVSIGQAAGPSVYAVFLATAAYINSHPDVIQRWANATQAALRWTAVAPLEDAVTTAAAFLPQVDRGDLASAIQRYRQIGMWQSDATVSRQAIDDVQTMMIESGIVPPDKRIPYETVVEPRFAEAAKPATAR